MLSRRYIRLFFCLSLLLLPMLQGCAVPRPVDLSTISPEEEATFARRVNPYVLQRLGATLQDADGQAYLENLTNRIMSGHAPVTVQLVNDPEPAAFVLPGRTVVVSRGVFYQLESEQDLAALLAHLFGHLPTRDGLQVVASAALRHGFQAGIAPGPDYDAATLAADLLTTPFNEAQELAADRNAADLLRAAGYSPSRLLNLAAVGQRQATKPDVAYGLLTLHPQSAERRRALEAMNAAFKAGTALGASASEPFDALRARILETRDAYELYRQAVHAEKKGQREMAIDLYLQAASSAPEEVLLLTGLGMAYMRQEVLVAARQHLSRASRIDNDYYYPQLGLGYIYLQQGDLTQAIKRLRRGQALLPTAEGSILLAQAFDLAGERDSALKLYREAIRNFPDDRLVKIARERIANLEAAGGLD